MTASPANVRRFPRPRAAGHARGAQLWDRLGFWGCVFILLMYSQFWVMQITGPVVAVDPNVSASLRNYFIPVYALTLAFVLLHGGALAIGIARSPLMTLLIGVAFVSAVWSIDPEVTGRRAMAVLLTTLSGMVMAVRFRTWSRFVETFATAFAILTVLSFAEVVLRPTYGIMTTDFPGAWRGVWDHKNTLGYNMTVGFVAFAAAAMLNPARRWLWLGFAAAAIALVLLSTSKTSLVSCLIGLLCMGAVWISRRGPVGAVLAIYLALTGLCAAGFLVAADPDVVLAALGKDETLTGRTQIWSAVMRQIAQRPWTGYGYGAVWTETSNWGPLPWISKEQGFVIHEAHNGWLGVWLELGYIGLFFAAATLIDVWTRVLIGVFRRPSTYFTLPFLAIFTLHSITESALLAQNDFVWLILSALCLKVAAPESAPEELASSRAGPRPSPRAPWPMPPARARSRPAR